VKLHVRIATALFHTAQKYVAAAKLKLSMAPRQQQLLRLLFSLHSLVIKSLQFFQKLCPSWAGLLALVGFVAGCLFLAKKFEKRVIFKRIYRTK